MKYNHNNRKEDWSSAHPVRPSSSNSSYRKRSDRLKQENQRLERDRKRGRNASIGIAVVAAAVIFLSWKGGALNSSVSAGKKASTGTPAAQTQEQSAQTSARDKSSSQYDIMLNTAMGPMLYYNQNDSLWSSYRWGGTDDIATYGCGPTCMAMIVNAFGNTGEQYTPITMCDWEYKNKQFARGHGSYHTIVVSTLPAFGLQVTSMRKELTADAIDRELNSGHILVALMGNGYFTDNGHFIILRSLNPDGTVNIADPNSLENTNKTFTADFLVNELNHGTVTGGGPLWSVAPAQ